MGHGCFRELVQGRGDFRRILMQFIFIAFKMSLIFLSQYSLC